MAITVRELVTKLGFVVDDKKIEAFDKRVAALKTNLFRLVKVAAVVGGAIAAITFKTAAAGDEIAKTSRRLGLGVESLQEWRFAAKRAGIEAATFDMAFQRFGRRAAEAARGQGEARDALAEMGIQLTDVNGKLREADTLFEESLIALSKQRTAFDRNRLAMKLFDSEGVRLVQLAEEGAEGIRALLNRARELGVVISEDAVKAAEEFTDKWTDVKAVLVGVAFALGEELLPIFSELLKDITQWIAENRKLVILLGKVALAIGIATLVVTAAIVPVSALAVAWAALNSQIFAVPIAIGLAIAAVIAFIAIMALLIEDIVAFTKGKDSVFGRFIQGLQTLAAILKENLVNAFTSAWEIIRERALVIWSSIMDRIAQMWESFVGTRLDPILDAFERIQKIIGFTSPTAVLTRGAAGLAGPAAQAVAGPTTMDIDIAVAPPQGTSERGVGQAVVGAFKASLHHLTMGRTGLGR
jgi:hypothetical protein